MFGSKQGENKIIRPEIIRSDEQLILVIRKHWLIFLIPLIIPAIFIIAIFIGFSFLVSYFKIPPTSFIFGILVILKGVFSLLVAYFGLLGWLKEYYDLGFVTNKRIIDVDQVSLFTQEISELPLEKVQDVTAKKQGILQTYLDYGDVIVQTASELPNFEFLQIPKPYFVAQVISQTVSQALKQTNQNIKIINE